MYYVEKISLVISLFGFFYTIFSCFIEVDGSKKLHFTPFKCIILICLLFIFCFKITVQFDGTNDDDSPIPEPNTQNTSSIEELIENNYNKIIQEKNKYTLSEATQIENRYVNLLICENAGTVYSYSEGEKEISSQTLCGKNLPNVKVILIDYETDNIIYSYDSNTSGSVTHFAQDGDRFYCVVITPEYNLYVSQPIFVVGKKDNKYEGLVSLCLKKEHDNYTTPFYIRLNIKDSNQLDQGYSILANESVSYRCIESSSSIDHSSFNSMYYSAYTNNHGFVSIGGDTYYNFELNDRYELDIQPRLTDNTTNKIPSFYDSYYQTLKEKPDNTNIIDCYFDYDGNEFTPYKSY